MASVPKDTLIGYAVTYRETGNIVVETEMSHELVARPSKRDSLIDSGQEAYADRFEVTRSIRDAAELADETPSVRIAGRIVSIRNLGGRLLFGNNRFEQSAEAAV